MTVDPAQSFDPIMLSMIRRAFPQLLAHSIIGVQPMTAPASSIFNRRTRYNYNPVKCFKMTKSIYFRQFLRLNNRKSYFSPEQIVDAGYPLIEFTKAQYRKSNDIFEWCQHTLPQGSWITNNHDLLAFNCDSHATLFKLTWSE